MYEPHHSPATSLNLAGPFGKVFQHLDKAQEKRIQAVGEKMLLFRCKDAFCDLEDMFKDDFYDEREDS